MEDGLDWWVKEELAYGKSHYVRWGRMVLRAIDVDDGLAILDIFSQHEFQHVVNGLNKIEKLAPRGADINTQTDMRGYAGHVWTAWLHNHIGDTALHISIKQKRMLCIYALLLLGARTDIHNEEGFDAKDLCMQVLGVSLEMLLKEARRGLAPCVDPRSYNRLPDSAVMRKYV